MKFTPIPSIAQSTNHQELGRQLQQSQKRDFNGLSQRQSRGLKEMQEASAPIEEIDDFKGQIAVEKERVRIRNFLMLKHGLDLATYTDPQRLAIFRASLGGNMANKTGHC